MSPHNPIERLVHELAKLPGVGEKTALRLALHVLRQPQEYGQNLARALQDTVTQVGFCENCFNLATEKLCPICRNPNRKPEQICLVEEIADLVSIERTHAFNGQYHVLHGALSPIDGIGPEDLRVRELIERLRRLGDEAREIVIATNPTVNGDATALYISRLLRPFEHLRVTRLASGIPVGGHIEFIDQSTLSKAFERRMEFI